MLRRLRITASVFFAMVCVAQCVLWVRSYWWTDVLRGTYLGTRVFYANSLVGRLQYIDGSVRTAGYPVFYDRNQLSYESRQYSDEYIERLKVLDLDQRPSPLHAFGFYVGNTPNCFELIVPHWFFVLTTASLTAVSWIGWSWRFSLRTMLIATTLVAVVLGSVVWLGRSI